MMNGLLDLEAIAIRVAVLKERGPEEPRPQFTQTQIVRQTPLPQ